RSHGRQPPHDAEPAHPGGRRRARAAAHRGRRPRPQERPGARPQRSEAGGLAMSLEIKVKDAAGKETGKTIGLPSSIFDVEPNIPLMHQVVTAQLAAARSGSANTKTRGEVRGGGKKPYRQ